jgi:hypothetical protein
MIIQSFATMFHNNIQHITHTANNLIEDLTAVSLTLVSAQSDERNVWSRERRLLEIFLSGGYFQGSCKEPSLSNLEKSSHFRFYIN